MEKKEALQWFVDFANMDLEAIKPGDKAKLLVEAEDYLWPKGELKEYQEGCPLPLTAKQLRCLAWTLEIPHKESQEYWTAILQSQKAIQQLFLRHLIPIARSSTDRPVSSSEKPTPSIVIRGHDEMLWWVGKGHKFPYKIKFLPVTGSQEDYLGLKIFMLLEGLPDHAIRVCPGCRKYFLNASLRKKEFCSPRCMWKVNSRKRREADPEGYREYQRKLMQDRYREKTGLQRRKTKSKFLKKS